MWRLENVRTAERLSKECPTVAPDLPPLPPCCRPAFDDDDGDGDDDEDADDDSVRAKLLKLRDEFWNVTEASDCWEVPLGRDLDAMPWLHRRTTGVLEAIEHARRVHGKTALLVDNSADKVVDTFFLYRAVQVLEAKAMVLEERTGRRNRAQVLEQARIRLVNAMRFGQTLYVRMSTSACQFKTTYSGPSTLPLAIFDQAAVDQLRARYSGPMGENLFGSSHPLAGCLREADTEHGFFTARHGFAVVLSTHLAKDDYRHFLERALPMDKLQPILPRVKQRPGQPDGGGGADANTSRAQVEEEEGRPYTLEDAQAAAVRLRECVEAMRARRESADGPPPSVLPGGSGAATPATSVRPKPSRDRGPPLDLRKVADDAEQAAERRAATGDRPPTTANGYHVGKVPTTEALRKPDGPFTDVHTYVTRCFATERDLERDRLDTGPADNGRDRA